MTASQAKVILGSLWTLLSIFAFLAQMYPKHPLLRFFLIKLSPRREDFKKSSSYYFNYSRLCVIYSVICVLCAFTAVAIAEANNDSPIAMGVMFISAILFLMAAVSCIVFFCKALFCKVKGS